MLYAKSIDDTNTDIFAKNSNIIGDTFSSVTNSHIQPADGW